MKSTTISAVFLGIIALHVETSNAQPVNNDRFSFNVATTFFPDYCHDGRSNLTVLSYPNRNDLCQFEGCPNTQIFTCPGAVLENEGGTICNLCNGTWEESSFLFQCSYEHSVQMFWTTDPAPQCQFSPACRNNEELFDCGAELETKDFEALCNLCDRPLSVEVDLGFNWGVSRLYEDRCGPGKDLYVYDTFFAFCWFEGCSYSSTFLCRSEILQQRRGEDYDAVCQYCDEQEHPDIYEVKTVDCGTNQSVAVFWNATDPSQCRLQGCPYFNDLQLDCHEAVNADDDAAFCRLCGTEEYLKALSKFSNCSEARYGRYCEDYCGDGHGLYFIWPSTCYLPSCGPGFDCIDFVMEDDDESICQCTNDLPIDGPGGPVDEASCVLYPDCEGLDGNCCSTDAGIDLFCCGATDASCQAHSACQGLAGDCCPTSDNVFLDCCENDFAKCEAHANCSHLVGDCCPTESGTFLDCCENDNSLEEFTFPENPTLAACSANSECNNLSGDCCPTESGAFLYCCQKISAKCQNHPKCAAEELANDCCPTSSGVYLDCCEKPFADAEVHTDCEAAGKTGAVCPYPNGTFDDCCFDDQLAEGVVFEALLEVKSGAGMHHLTLALLAVFILWGWLH